MPRGEKAARATVAVEEDGNAMLFRQEDALTTM